MMKKRVLIQWFVFGVLAIVLSACNQSETAQDSNATNTECNTTCDVGQKNNRVYASNFSVTLDVNQTKTMVNWKEKSSVISDNNGTIIAAIKTQGQYGIFALDGDTLLYVRDGFGNLSDQAVLQISEGNSSVDINVTVESNSECNTTCVCVQKNGPVHASDFSVTLDANQTKMMVKWKEKSVATSEDNGTFAATIKTQGQYGTFALDGDTLLYVREHLGQLTDQAVLQVSEGNSSVEINVTVDSKYWKTIAAGRYYTMAIKSDGTLWGWGANNFGQIGDGTTVDRPTPVQVGSDTHWSKVYAKFSHTIGIKDDGTLWAWGYNRYGQLGDGTIADKHEPRQEPSKSTNWTMAAIGYYHTVALKNDGSLWASGRNNYGQLGDNTIVDKHVFTKIANPADKWTAVAAGYYHSLAIKDDKTLWAWGHNNYGQLGDNTTADKHVPTQENAGDKDWAFVAAGYNHSLALKDDGSLFGWGINNYAQIGDGSRTNRHIPTQEASAATDWVEIDGGNSQSVARKSDGTLWAWGYNNYGQIGENIVTYKYAPERLDDQEYMQVIGAEYHTAGLTTNGVIQMWGAVAGARTASE